MSNTIEPTFKNYTPQKGYVRNFTPDQTIIINKKFLSYCPGLSFTDEVGAPPHYHTWYPFVNSYYQFTENVDAYARVNHLIESEPSLDSSGSLFYADASRYTPPYTEHEAQLRYINSKPVCFLILGKPEIGQENLGRRLAASWKCLHIEPQSLLEDEIESGSRAGQCIEFNLRCGRAIGVDVILRLLAYKVQSPSARHRGYVISGFPLIPNDLYEEDPISSESAVFNAKDIFEEIVDNTKNILNVSTIGLVQTSLSSQSTIEATFQRDFDLSLDETSVHTQICGPPDIATDSEKQINCLFGLSWELFIIIYVACETSDVISKRSQTYFDVYSRKIVDMQKMNLFLSSTITKEGLADDVLDAGVNPLVENPKLRHLVRVPHNLESQVATQLDRFHNHATNLIDRQILMHDVQYYIRLDGRLLLSEMLDIIKMRLKVLPIQQVLLPERLSLTFDTPDEAPPVDPSSLEDTFIKLSTKQIVAPAFKWSLSDWNYFGPVKMKEGAYLKGEPNLAVQFLNKIFFLADSDSLKKFLENPRTYLRPPLPKPGCRILVFGPPLSGCTTVCRALAYMFDGQVLNTKDMLLKYTADQRVVQKEKNRQSAILEALSVLEDKSLSVTDPFVVNYVNEKLASVGTEELEMTDDRILEMYVSTIADVESQKPSDGWIIDNPTTNIEMLQQICDCCIVDNVVFLTMPLKDLEERNNGTYQYQYSDYRNFFHSIGEHDAAWRCPSNLSTASYKNQVASELLTEIIDSLSQDSGESIDYMEDHKRKMDLYAQAIPAVRNFFKQLDCQVFEVDNSNLSTEELMAEVIQLLKEPYRQKATPYTDRDRAEEVQQFLASLATQGETETGLDWQVLEQQRRYGYTKFYCPVTFTEKWVLWKGKDQYGAKFESQIYLMASDQDLQKFLAAPRNYLNHGKPPTKLPPPRICLVGVPGSGKTTIAKLLARNLGVRYVSYDIVNDTDIEQFVTRLWFDDPLRPLGFVVDDFPRNPSDIEVMVDHKAIPDCVIWAVMDREINTARLFKKYNDKWTKIELARKEQVKGEWEQRRQVRYNELMDAKRENRYLSKLQEDFTSATQISIDSIADQEDVDEINTILDQELPEPSFSELPQDLQQISTTIDDNFQQFTDSLQQVKVLCGTQMIPWFNIDANLTIDKVAAQAFRATNDIKSRSNSLFESCFVLTLETANKLLNKGYYFLSHFGRNCPLQVLDRDNPMQLYSTLEERGELFPVVNRQCIYFISGSKNRDRFMKSPLKYTTKPCNFPLVPFRLAVIGPPKSGKSTLAKRYESQCGYKRFSRGQAVRRCLSEMSFCALSKSMEERLRTGGQLSDDMTIGSVYANPVDTVTGAVIFDGFPNTINEMNVMARYGLVPHLIIDLQATKTDILRYSQLLPISQHPIYSTRLVEKHYENWATGSDIFRIWCDREYQNIARVPATKSLWGIWDAAYKVTLAVLSEIKHYHQYVQHDWALRIASMLITPLEFLERQSSYKTFCPVCWYQSKTLKSGGEPPDRTGLIHFREYFYWLCSEHIDLFLQRPEIFLPPSNTLLPQNLPQVVQLTEIPSNVYEEGLCVVCVSDSRPERCLKTGIIDHAISYLNCIYLFDSDECLWKFMANPHLYSGVVVNFKNADDYPDLRYDQLPNLGYLEQYMAQLLVQAVNHIGVTRPLIAGLSISTSALIGIGLYLKAHSPKSPDVATYKQALDSFHQRRKDLLKALDYMKERLNPYLNYVGPEFSSSSSSTSGTVVNGNGCGNNDSSLNTSPAESEKDYSSAEVWRRDDNFD